MLWPSELAALVKNNFDFYLEAIMRVCKCGANIPYRLKLNDHIYNLQNRRKCLNCLPFKSIIQSQPPEVRRAKNREKSLRYCYRKVAAAGGKCPINIRRICRKRALLDILFNHCQFCNYNRTINSLSFHHISDRKFGLSSSNFNRQLSKLLPEISKCVITCHNCHTEIHDGLIADNLVNTANDSLKLKAESLAGKTWADIGINRS